MEPARAAQALAHASASMIRPSDVLGALAALLDDCRAGLDVDAGGVLVMSANELELLAASSHAISELETHQLHIEEGPCIEAYQTGVSVQSASPELLMSRWPNFSKTMLAAGFQAVLAAPLTMQGTTLGALGLFRRSNVAFTATEAKVAQAFADIASTLIVHLTSVTPHEMSLRVQETLDARVLVEQAKGVLADAHDLSMAGAYELLVQNAASREQPLTEWASEVIKNAQTDR